MDLPPTFIVAGRLLREYLLPPVGQPRLDSPGGSLLYAAGGLAVWDSGNAGLLAKVGEDLPRKWLTDLKTRGFDVSGIKILHQSVDLRSFIAYNDFEERTTNNPVTHFARREMTFPKALLGYQPPPETSEDRREPEPLALAASDIPKGYLDARAAHLCPMDFATHTRLVSALKAGSITTVSLDPAPGYMLPSFKKDFRALLHGVTVFLPSEQELRALFWGETHDVWEMAEAVGAYGCDLIIVKCGGKGQLVYNVLSKQRWEIPAYPARLADPTGAGDAFCGGFLAAYYKTYDPLEAALHGGISASLKVEGSGPFYGLGVLHGLAEARLSALRELVREV
ncbi:MAG TPA: carbohydrate kinase family protein [Anaerolineales bacterium]|jgi:sugar/nucleoside kinase (ribokinase family)